MSENVKLHRGVYKRVSLAVGSVPGCSIVTPKVEANGPGYAARSRRESGCILVSTVKCQIAQGLLGSLPGLPRASYTVLNAVVGRGVLRNIGSQGMWCCVLSQWQVTGRERDGHLVRQPGRLAQLGAQ